MEEKFSRSEMIFKNGATDFLKKKSVLVFGLGGVGGYVVEGLARAGIGKITLVDNDKITPSNINRQIYALSSTVGEYKTGVAESRCLDINPEIIITKKQMFVENKNIDEIPFKEFDYVVDAIDTVTSKLAIIKKCNDENVPVISCMGTGNKIKPEMLEISDIYKTSVCPLARVVREKARKMNIKKLKVVYSKEEPVKEVINVEGRNVPGSVSFVPPVAGFLISGEVIKDLLRKENLL